jgi:hypothetical protein
MHPVLVTVESVLADKVSIGAFRAEEAAGLLESRSHGRFESGDKLGVGFKIRLIILKSKITDL